MAVRTYYGVERVSVKGPNGTRLAGTVSGVAGGRVVVALDEPSEFYPVGFSDEAEDGSLGGESYPIPGSIAQVLETDLEFFVDGDVAAPSFTREQLAYLRRTYGEQAEAVVASEASASSGVRPDNDDEIEDDEPDAATLAAAAAAAVKAQGGGLSKEKVAAAKLPDGA